MNITILGCGAYGIALSNMFLKNNCNITMWTKIKNEYEMLKNKRTNEKVLPGYYIDKSIKLTMNMNEAIQKANIIVIAIPVKYINDTVTELKTYYNKNQHICIASKGIMQDTYLFPYKIVSKILKSKNIGIISGGTFAIDMVNEVPMGILCASKNTKTVRAIKKSLENEYLSVDTSHDVFGTEFWGAIKNIIAIGCGIIEGMNLPESTRAMFFSKCFNEIMNLVYSLNGNKSSALTYAGIEDLFLTCTSQKSRNYTFGKMIGKKMNKSKIDKYIQETTVEGYYTLKSFYEMLRKKKKKSLIIETMYSIIYKEMDINLLIDYLKK